MAPRKTGDTRYKVAKAPKGGGGQRNCSGERPKVQCPLWALSRRQTDFLLELIAKQYRQCSPNRIVKLLLPEARINLSNHSLNMTYKQAQEYLQGGNNKGVNYLRAKLRK